MRTLIATAALALLTAPAAVAQPYGGAPPPGSYQRSCSNIRMEGQFLHGFCRGANGSGESSINVQSCSTDIFVNASGALACVGPGGGEAPRIENRPPGFYTGTAAPPNAPPPPAYRDDRRYGDQGGDRRRGRGEVTLYAARDFRGPSVTLRDAESNLSGSGMNDRVRSIQLGRGSGPWRVCSDARFKGRCVTIDRSVRDTRDLGLGGISSIGPDRSRGW